jgi:hypothetical protein
MRGLSRSPKIPLPSHEVLGCAEEVRDAHLTPLDLSRMPISARFVVNSTILLLTVGFLVLFGIVGMTVWLGERARSYSDEAARLRDIRVAAVELRSALQSAESSQRGFLVGGNDILPRALTRENLDEYERDVADPGAVYRDPQKRAAYLKMYGNICFDTRDQYINFPWSSERK